MMKRQNKKPTKSLNNQSTECSAVTFPQAEKPTPLFELGNVYIERVVLDCFSLAQLDEYLADHVALTPDTLSYMDTANEHALFYCGPIYHRYANQDENAIDIVTDADRSRTTILFHERQRKNKKRGD